MGWLVRQGSKGADVRAIQDVLNFHIRRSAPLAVDGDFGSRTHARVIEFQRSNQLQADGIVGPLTMAKLLEEEQLQITLALVPRRGIDGRWPAARHPAASPDPAIDVATADAASVHALPPSARLVIPHSGADTRRADPEPSSRRRRSGMIQSIRRRAASTRSCGSSIACRSRFLSAGRSSAPCRSPSGKLGLSSSTRFRP